MEFRQLEYFLAVAESLSFGKAAKKLNVSQPAISKQIKLLEEELGIKLFDETQKTKHKRVLLTAEGSYFLLEAAKIIKLRKEALEGLQRLKSKKKTVILGLYKTLPKGILSEVLTILNFPDYEIKLREYESVEEVEEAVMRGEIRFGITLSFSRPENSFLLHTGNLQVSIFEKHVLAETSGVFLHQLKSENTIQSDLNIGLASTGLSSFEHNISLIQSGFGVGVFPSFYPHLLVSKDLKSASSKTEEFRCYQLLLYKEGTKSSLVQRLKKSL